MPFVRTMVQDGGLQRIMRAGDGWDNPVLAVVATDAAATISAAQIIGGVIQYTGFTAGRILTTDTAVNILAAMPTMDIGDSLGFTISIIPAFAGTFAAGTGVTLAGRPTCPAATSVTVYVTKTSSTTVLWTVL